MLIILFEVFVYEEYNKNEKNLFCARKKNTETILLK